jgi:cytochrome c oxidase subunit 1/cytochrome c oxidase subunit I+III
MFGHPWVYAIVLPAMGIVSDGLPTFCRRPLVGYTPVALATVTTMVLGFGVWVHHMFATGLPPVALSFFSAASFAIVIPSAVAVFAWLGTIWTGRPVFKTPFFFFAGFVMLFVIGGLSGFMTASVPVDRELTDTYFVVAHLHYVIVGINVFAVVGGIYYWFPKFTGRMLGERLGKWNFWVMFIGFNIGFFPMHILGLLGMPRRIYTYPAVTGWGTLNMAETIGALILTIGILISIWNFFVSMRRGAVAGRNPWNADSLEWDTESPPAVYNSETIPVVTTRHPLWDDFDESHDPDHDRAFDQGRVTVVTSTLDGVPIAVAKMPEDTLTPFLMAVALTVLFAALLLKSMAVAAAATLLCLLVAAVWLWPEEERVVRA